MSSALVQMRRATIADVPAIVRMLADDMLGQQREQYRDPLPPQYLAAFQRLDADPNHELMVAELEGNVVGTLHLMVLPSLSFQGGSRAQIESVRVDREYRNHGIGGQMMRWAIARARERGCRLVQLTTQAQRTEAHRFYQRLGFSASHVGMKIDLQPSSEASPPETAG